MNRAIIHGKCKIVSDKSTLIVTLEVSTIHKEMGIPVSDSIDISCLRPDPRCVVPSSGLKSMPCTVSYEPRWTLDRKQYWFPVSITFKDTKFVNCRDIF
jgi:hypothetical protein